MQCLLQHVTGTELVAMLVQFGEFSLVTGKRDPVASSAYFGGTLRSQRRRIDDGILDGLTPLGPHVALAGAMTGLAGNAKFGDQRIGRHVSAVGPQTGPPMRRMTQNAFPVPATDSRRAGVRVAGCEKRGVA